MRENTRDINSTRGTACVLIDSAQSLRASVCFPILGRKGLNLLQQQLSAPWPLSIACFSFPADCRRRGTFNSFASHFRGRRSVDQSYPEDRPVDPRLADRAEWRDFDVVEEYNEDEEGSEGISESPQQAGEEKKQAAAAEEELEKCFKEDVDIMDVRIEGMEAAMMEMNNLVHLMQKKVS